MPSWPCCCCIANQPVSAERLALALWGEEAPAGATRAVQVYVSRLRKALGDPDAITTTPAGYRLRVRPGELDAERFERGVEAGRRALDAGAPEQAAGLLREALELWRGPPLAGLEFEPFAQAEIARLEEQRLAALEARVEADLGAGRHAALVSELRQLLSEHPTRERFAAHLMLALYRSGRQAEALEVYRDTRRVLVDEAGIEPGPELQRLHRAVLDQDASLDSTPSAGDVPRELDAETAPPLVGRDAELARLREHWQAARNGARPLVAVCGVEGIGKTRLAAELAGERASRRRRGRATWPAVVRPARWSKRLASCAARRARRSSSSTTPTGASRRGGADARHAARAGRRCAPRSAERRRSPRHARARPARRRRRCVPSPPTRSPADALLDAGERRAAPRAPAGQPNGRGARRHAASTRRPRGPQPAAPS